MSCTNIPQPMTQISQDKPKGEEFVREIERMGFELPLGVVMHLWDGRYESFSIDTEENIFTVKIFGYKELVIHKTKFTGENTKVDGPIFVIKG